MDTNMDRGDTRHLQWEVLVVPQGEKVYVVLGTAVIQVEPHHAKIVKRESEHCHEAAMKEVIHPQKVAHKKDDQTVVAPMVHQSGD